MANHDVNHLTLIFAALSDPTRRAVIERLQQGPATVAELACPFPVAASTFSKHLRQLEECGLVERVREGRLHRIRLRLAAIAQLAAWTERFSPAGGPHHSAMPALAQLPVAAQRVVPPGALQRAIALKQALAAEMAVVRQALIANASVASEFTPVAAAARVIASQLAWDASLMPQLQLGLGLYERLVGLLACEAAPSEELLGVVYALSQVVFAWRSHPGLRDVLSVAS
jgi:DNA-binding transcriptional ArsR family regulator